MQEREMNFLQSEEYKALQEKIAQENAKNQQSSSDEPQGNENLNPDRYSSNEVKRIVELAQNQKDTDALQGKDEYFRSTNIQAIDDKLRDGTLTAREAIAIRNRLGLNVSDYGYNAQNINLNAKVKGMNVTKINEQMYQNMENNNILDEAILASDGNLGLTPQASRKMHEYFGYWQPDNSNRYFMGAQDSAKKAYASAIANGGKPTNYTLQMAENNLGLTTERQGTYLEKMLAAKKLSAISTGINIENAIKNGVPISSQVLKNYENLTNSISYLEDSTKGKKNFNYAEYAKIVRGGYQNQNGNKKNESGEWRKVEKK